MVVHFAVEGGCRDQAAEGGGGLARRQRRPFGRNRRTGRAQLSAPTSERITWARAGTADFGVGVAIPTLQRYGSGIAIYLRAVGAHRRCFIAAAGAGKSRAAAISQSRNRVDFGQRRSSCADIRSSRPIRAAAPLGSPVSTYPFAVTGPRASSVRARSPVLPRPRRAIPRCRRWWAGAIARRFPPRSFAISPRRLVTLEQREAVQVRAALDHAVLLDELRRTDRNDPIIEQLLAVQDSGSFPGRSEYRRAAACARNPRAPMRCESAARCPGACGETSGFAAPARSAGTR